MTMKCPTCQFEQPENRLDCECCGLVFSKWRERNAPPDPTKTSDGNSGDSAAPVDSISVAGLPAREKYLYQQLAAMDFQQAVEGHWVYFPWGSFGKGFDCNDPELKKRIGRYVGIFSCVHCPFLALLWTFNLLAWLYYPNYRLDFALYFLVYLVTAYVLFWVAATRWVSELPQSTHPYNQSQYLKSFSMIFYWKYLIQIEVVSLFFLIAGIWLWLTGNFFTFFESNPVFVQRFWLIASVLALITSTYLHYFREKK